MNDPWEVGSTPDLPAATRLDPWEVAGTDSATPSALKRALVAAAPGIFNPRGVIQGIADPFVGGAQLIAHGVDAAFPGHDIGSTADELVKSYDANYQHPEGMDTARMAGNVVNPATFVSAPTRVATMFPRATAALTGAAQSALSPETGTNYWTDKGLHTAEGAGLGGAAGVGIKGLNTLSEDANKLAERGVGVGVSPWASDILAKNPLTGVFIRAYQTDSLKDYGLAVVKQALKPLGDAVGQLKPNADVRDVIGHAQDIVGKVYDSVLGRTKPIAASDVARVSHNIAGQAVSDNQFLGEAGAHHIMSSITSRMQDMISAFGGNGALSGADLKQLDSEIGHQARQFSKSADPLHQLTGETWYDIQQGFREQVIKPLMNSQADYDLLTAANAAHRNLLTTRKALGAADHIFPRRLRTAAEKAKSADLSTIAREGIDVLPGSAPHSTPIESFMAHALPLAIGGVGGLVGVGIPSLAAGLAFGTKTGNRLLTGNTVAQRAMLPYKDRMASAMAATLRGQQ